MKDRADETSPPWLAVARSPIVRLIVLGGAVFFMMGVSSGFMSKLKATPLLSLAAAAGIAALALCVYVAWARFVEGRPASELSVSGMGRELGIGLVVGAGLYTACVLILMIMGVYRIEGTNAWAYMLPALSMALNSGIFEELVFRGVLFKSVDDWCGSWIALCVSSLVFGLVHLFNPAGTLLGALFISVEAGVLLAAAYMLTRRLWMSMGFHMSWNYTQSGVFSGIVSGSDTDPGLFKSRIEGPAALTGGSFGLESSLIAFLLCTTTGVVLLVMAVRGGKIVPPVWMRASRGQGVTETG